MYQRFKRIPIFLAVALLATIAVGFGAVGVHAQAEPITIRTQDETVLPGGSIVVPIDILVSGSNESVAAVGMELSYDPTVLSASACSFDSGFSGACNTSTQGTVSISAINTEGANSDFTLVAITFDAVGADTDVSALSLTVNNMSNAAGVSLTNQAIENGQIMIQEPMDPAQRIAVRTQDADVRLTQSIDVPIELVLNESNQSIGAVGMELSYDPAVLSASACTFANGFSGACNISTPGAVSISAINTAGADSDFVLATITFDTVGAVADSSSLDATIDSLTNTGGTELNNREFVSGQIMIIDNYDPAERITVQTPDTEVRFGESVNVPIEILLNESNQSIGAVSILINYDATVFSVDSCDFQNGFDGACGISNPGVINISTINAQGMDSDFNLAVITFSTVGERGESTMLSTTVRNLSNVNGEDWINREVVNAELLIMPFTRGDVNCNDIPDTVDALFIMQYEIEERTDAGDCPLTDATTQLNAIAGDVNIDGFVNVVDSLFILQCVVELSNVFCPSDVAVAPGDLFVAEEAVSGPVAIDAITENSTVTLTASGEVAAGTFVFSYDHSVASFDSCAANVAAAGSSAMCSEVSPGMVRISYVNPQGSNAEAIVDLSFNSAANGTVSMEDLTVLNLVDSNGRSVMVEETSFNNLMFLPFLSQ